MPTSSSPPTSAGPLEIARVALRARDRDRLARFYEAALGLRPLSGDDGVVRLGAGGRVLLEIRGDASAAPVPRREAGLFHTAFLLPGRAALGRWVRHAAEARLPLQGASDHLVSEAIYLADPEGNGIEVYADRPREGWATDAGAIRMATDPLDLDALARAADGPWTGAPDGTVVGHVHLQVGDVAEAERFYGGVLGLAVMAHYPGATFLASGGYHHHLGANVWNSRGAGARTPGAAGLDEVTFAADPDLARAIAARAGGARIADPWGTRLVVEPKAA